MSGKKSALMIFFPDFFKKCSCTYKQLKLGKNRIMIAIIKCSTASFLLKADTQGIEEMLMYIKALSDKSEEYLQISYLGNERNFAIELNSDVDEILIYSSRKFSNYRIIYPIE